MKYRTKLYVLFLFFGLIAGLLLVRKNNYIKSLAQTPEIVGAVNVTSRKLEGSENISQVDILFRTGSDNSHVESVSSVGLRATISNSSNSKLVLVDKNGNKINTVESAVSGDNSDWEIPINKVNEEGNNFIIDFAAVNLNLSGYSSNEFKSLATFYIKNEGQSSENELRFDKDLSGMYSKSRPTTNIWDTSDLGTFKLSL